MIRELFAKYQFGTKHAANIIPGEVVIRAVFSADSALLCGLLQPSYCPPYIEIRDTAPF